MRLAPLQALVALSILMCGFPAKTPPVPDQPFCQSVGRQIRTIANTSSLKIQCLSQDIFRGLDYNFTEGRLVLYRLRTCGNFPTEVKAPSGPEIEVHLPRFSHSLLMKTAKPSPFVIGYP